MDVSLDLLITGMKSGDPKPVVSNACRLSLPTGVFPSGEEILYRRQAVRIRNDDGGIMLDLKLREEFRGKRLKGTTVDFTNTSKTGALDVSAADFLKITYPSFDLLKTVEATGPGQSRPVVLLGARGQGKSHLLAALYHLSTSAQVGHQWLGEWATQLNRPEIGALKLRSECCVIAESLHLHRYKFLWDILFERHPHGKFFEGKWQGLGDKKTDVPSDLILVEMFQKQPAVVIFDEFQTWFEGLTNTKQYPFRNWAFNFIQILSEIAQRNPELLTLVVSVRDGSSDAYQQIHRVNPVIVDFQGPQAKRDRQRLLLHRIFENRLQVPAPKINGIIHHHINEYFRLARIPQPEQERRHDEFLEAWPFAPHLLRLLDDQVLIAADAQETRDLIKILVDLYKQVGEAQPIITAADFSLTNEQSGVASLLDSVANELHKELRAKALKNLELLKEAVPDVGKTLPHLEEIVSALWLRSLTLDKVAGADPADLQIDITRSKPLDDNNFEAELATIEESSFNIHRVGTRLVFKQDENLRTKLLAHAKNDKLFPNSEDIDHLAKEIRSVISGPEHVSQGFRVVVLRRMWNSDPWSEFEEKDQPKSWQADGKLPMVVVPEHPDKLDATLGSWLTKFLQDGRNTIRFLLPAKGTNKIFYDKELLVLSRAVYLAMQWKKDEPAYVELQRKFQGELTAKLKPRFDRFALLDLWNFADATKCRFEERSHGAQGDKIPEAVDKIIKQDVFIPEEFEEYVLLLAESSESVGKLLKDLREPRPGGKPCIPWLGETEIKERVVKMCAAGQIAINLRGLDLLQARPGESYDDAWNRMKGKIGYGRHLDETTIHKPGAVVLSGGVTQPVVGPGGTAVVAPGVVGVVNPVVGLPVTVKPGDGSGLGNLFGDTAPSTGKKQLAAPPTSGLNLLGHAESWGIGPATPLTNVALRIGKMTGAQLQQLLKNLPDGVTYGLEAEKDAVPASCWIKADCTFHGLSHVLHEPDDRVFLGEVPPSVVRVQQNKTKYIRSISVKKTSSSNMADNWFDCDLPLNHGLVAIVGNKGSGKSALADILGLLGNSKNGVAFSFLSAKKFCQPKDNKAEHFEGGIVWQSGHARSRTLAERVDDADVESVRYIPQAYLEDICNELSDPHQGGFGRELRAVIYSHVQEADRLGHSCLDDLLEYRTRETSQAITRLKGPLQDAVKAFVKLLDQSAESHRKAIANQLTAKNNELATHRLAKPAEVMKPQSDPAMLAQTAQIEKAIEETERELQSIEAQLTEANQNRLLLSRKVAAADKFLTRIDNITASIEAFRSESETDCDFLGITIDEVFSSTSSKEPLSKKKGLLEQELQKVLLSIGTPATTGYLADKATTDRDLERLRSNLDAPNKAYQDYLVALRIWDEGEKALIGTVDKLDTVKFLERSLEELDQIPAKLDLAWGACVDASLAIFREIVKLTDAHRTTFGPVQEFVESHPLARGRYDLRFEASLVAVGFSDLFFAHINQGRRGSFCGVEEGRSRMQVILGKAGFENEESVRAFLTTIRTHLTQDLRHDPPDAVALSDQLAKGHTSDNLLSFVLGLEYLKPQVSLRWGGKDIEQLSPGERGTLLLVFYLLIDRSDTPLVIDQPEENLDNQTVVEFLVPSIKDAKARRQIILVTHNPNLAVVCDADQIICARMDKQDGHRISYTTGAIENPSINKCLLDILEGTRPAFDNRDGKYQCEKSHSRPRHRAVPFK